MSGGEFVLGLGLFGAVAVAGALMAVAVVRQLALDPLARLLAGTLVFVAAVMAIHLVPLLLAVLARGTVLAAAGAVAATGVVLMRRTTKRSEHAAAAPAPPPDRDGRPERILAAAVAILVLVAVAADVREWLPQVFRGVDTITFHLPNAQRWIQTGSLWQIDDYLPGQAHGAYPNHGELLFVWALLPFDSDFMVRAAIVPLLGVWALATVGVAREVGVSRATGVLVACALVSIPIVGISTVPRAMPDVVLYATMTTGLLFLLRHARTQQRSDLLLAGLGLGLGFGTKWYGVSTAAIAVLAFAIAQSRRTSPGRATRDGVLLTATIVVTGGVWLVRNLVELGNPVFPVKLQLLGVTIFDAPPDTVREQVGFSIAHYVTDPGVLFGKLPGELFDGAGLVIPLAVIAAVASVVLARGAGRALALGALILGAIYVTTPYTALGLEGDPNLAEFNTRYAVPAVVCALLAGGYAVRSRPRARLAFDAALAVAVVVGLPKAYGLPARQIVIAAIGLALAAGAVWLLWRTLSVRPRTVRRAVAAGVTAAVLAGGVAYAHRTEERFSTYRYAVGDPTIAAVEKLSAGRSHRVGLVGQWTLEGASPVWASFGPRLQNEVTYVGHHDGGFLESYTEPAAFERDLARHRYDLLVIGRGLTDPRPVPAETWAARTGYVPVAHSRRLVLLAAPWLRDS